MEISGNSAGTFSAFSMLALLVGVSTDIINNFNNINRIF
jgi:hypothetical protein